MDSQRYDQPDDRLVDLELRHVYKSFDNQEVIADLSLSVYKGELCCLLGPSGCGKTTTLKMIAGLLEPDAGAVILDGKDITRMPPQRRNVGLVFQNYALFPHMNVYDNVAYGLRRRKVPKDEIQIRVARVLGLVQLNCKSSIKVSYNSCCTINILNLYIVNRFVTLNINDFSAYYCFLSK